MPKKTPSAALLSIRIAMRSGRKSSATPPTPSAAPARARAVIGVPKVNRVPTRLMNTIVENKTATSPEVTYCSAR